MNITTDNTQTLINALTEIERLTAERDAAQADAKRFEWVLPILSGDDDSTADKRAVAMALQLAQGLTGCDAIDAAMKGEQP